MVAAVVGSVMLLAAAVLFALLPGQLSEAHDFRAARPCAELEGSVAENGDCLAEWPATVLVTEARRRGQGPRPLGHPRPGPGQRAVPRPAAGRAAGVVDARAGRPRHRLLLAR